MLLTACAPQPELKTIARVDGVVRELSQTEEAVLCQSQACEPNYRYYASFGRARPTPTPVPTPTPTPSPAPTSGAELDYSRAILQVTQAWQVTQGRPEIVVAVIDTGVDLNHPDLAPNLWRNQAEANGVAGVDDDHNGYVDDVYGWDFANNRPNAQDDNGHGTHVAGTIAALRNGIGSVGVAPLVKVMPVKFLDAQGSGATSDGVSAIEYAVANGAHILSNSWGGGSGSQFLSEAVAHAIALNRFFVAAAGNSSATGADYPGRYPNVISVASSNESDGLSSFSNRGGGITIAAPGSNIFNAYFNDTYKTISGTSMATPQVSGALALALSVSNNTARIRQELCDTAEKILLSHASCGRLNVNRLVRAVNGT